jgi:glutathione peroxidase
VWERYRDKGLLVLAVPSDDFNQELASDAEVKDFCEANFGLDFPMTKKASVKGPGAHPLYRWTAAHLAEGAVPRWNFHKILFDRDGQPVAGFNSSVEPESRELTEAIEAVLAKSPAAGG